MNRNIKKTIINEEFDYPVLLHALRDYKNPRVKINDLIKKGLIIRVKKGVYIFGPEWAQKPYNKEILANMIFGPSYISLEYALSFYGLIPERVETVTSITNKRNKIFQTPVGTFSYKHIHTQLYPLETTLVQMDNSRYALMATKEKALCDMLHFTEKLKDEEACKKYLIDALRIDFDDITTLRLTKVDLLAKYYGSNVKLLKKFLRRIK